MYSFVLVVHFAPVVHDSGYWLPKNNLVPTCSMPSTE
jgi:hypothetical protein